MPLAAYTLSVSVIYALLFVLAPAVASALLVLFVAMILLPGIVSDVRRIRRGRRR